MSATDPAEECAFWPQRDDLSAEFMRLMAAAQDGGSTIAECVQVARRIRGGDEVSWHREWTILADANRERGQMALAAGNVATARRNWLRAVNYYKASAIALDPADKRRWTAVTAMQDCARRFVEHCSPAGEVVQIPWAADHALQGYFLPAVRKGGPAPVVICVGEPGHRKEEYLYKLAPHARERGLSMLAVDLLGRRGDDFLDQLVARGDLHASLSHIVDFLYSRADVDHRRIAVLADGWGSSFVSRAVAEEPRVAAAVCDGGLWYLHEHAFLAHLMMGRDASIVPMPDIGGMVRNRDCPVLVTLGEEGWLKADRVRQMVRRLKAQRLDITLKVFTAEETAAAQGHADNPSLANEYIFDWVASRLSTVMAEPAW